MGVDIPAFNLLLQSGFEELWNTQPIPRNDVSSAGAPRVYRRSLDAAGGLGLVLHYLNSTMREYTLQQIFALTPAVASRYIDFSLDILLVTLRRMREAAIRWPRDQEFALYAEIVQRRHRLLDGAIGTMDGLKNLGADVARC